jgi:hypothetical protein
MDFHLQGGRLPLCSLRQVRAPTRQELFHPISDAEWMFIS